MFDVSRRTTVKCKFQSAKFYSFKFFSDNFFNKYISAKSTQLTCPNIFLHFSRIPFQFTAIKSTLTGEYTSIYVYIHADICY